MEHHPQDCRVKIAKDGICQALSQKMGTGGGNVPLVIEVDDAEDEGIKRRKWSAASDGNDGGVQHSGYHARCTGHSDRGGVEK